MCDPDNKESAIEMLARARDMFTEDACKPLGSDAGAKLTL